jgi:G3E family GTPase
VDEGDVDSLEIRIRDMKQGARILRTSKSQVPLPLILSVGLFESDKYFDTEEEHHDHHHHDHDHDHCDHDHDHDHHDHSNHLEVDGFTSISFASDQPFSIRKFQYFLDNQLPESVFQPLRVFSGLMRVLNVIFSTSVVNVLLSKMMTGKVVPKIS